MAETEDYDKSATPTAHKTSHQDGGSDEISVAALSGELADDQKSTWAKVSGKPTTFAPEAHKTSHQDGGADEISLTGLAGLSVTPQTPAAHKTSHQDGGTDEMSVQGLAGLLADAQTPLAHKTSHQDGGVDEMSVQGLAGLLADAQTPLPNSALVNSAARAYLNNAQSITPAAIVKILFDAETYDVGGNFDLTNSKYIVPTAGKYLIVGGVYWEGAPGTGPAMVFTYIGVNGARPRRTSTWQDDSIGNIGSEITDILDLAVNDEIDIRVWTDEAQRVLASSSSSFISVHRLS